MRLDLPRKVFLFFQTLSFAVGDTYVLALIYDHSIGRIFSSLDSGHRPWNSNFEQYGNLVEP